MDIFHCDSHVNRHMDTTGPQCPDIHCGGSSCKRLEALRLPGDNGSVHPLPGAVCAWFSLLLVPSSLPGIQVRFAGWACLGCGLDYFFFPV